MTSSESQASAPNSTNKKVGSAMDKAISIGRKACLGIAATGLAGAAYMFNHHAPEDPNDVVMNGQPMGECPKTYHQAGRITTFRCVEADGTAVSVDFPTDAITNHGTFAGVENFLDRNDTMVAGISGTALGSGLGYYVWLAVAAARRREDSEPVPDTDQ